MKFKTLLVLVILLAAAVYWFWPQFRQSPFLDHGSDLRAETLTLARELLGPLRDGVDTRTVSTLRQRVADASLPPDRRQALLTLLDDMEPLLLDRAAFRERLKRNEGAKYDAPLAGEAKESIREKDSSKHLFSEAVITQWDQRRAYWKHKLAPMLARVQP